MMRYQPFAARFAALSTAFVLGACATAEQAPPETATITCTRSRWLRGQLSAIARSKAVIADMSRAIAPDTKRRWAKWLRYVKSLLI